MKKWKLLYSILSIVIALYIYTNRYTLALRSALLNIDASQVQSSMVVSLFLIVGSILSLVMMDGGMEFLIAIIFAYAGYKSWVSMDIIPDLMYVSFWCLLIAFTNFISKVTDLCNNPSDKSEESKEETKEDIK